MQERRSALSGVFVGAQAARQIERFSLSAQFRLRQIFNNYDVIAQKIVKFVNY
jgi:hypothetical protein